MPLEDVTQSSAASYLLRTTQQHHVHLSAMADQKANIMIASTSILLTFAFANFKQANLFWGFLALFIFAFIALVLAIMAVAPNFAAKKNDSAGNTRNPLFFGHFTDLSLEEFEDEMAETLETDAGMYRAQVADIYGLGMSIRDGKYRYLSWSYRVFLTGIVTAGFLFLLQTAVFYVS